MSRRNLLTATPLLATGVLVGAQGTKAIERYEARPRRLPQQINIYSTADEKYSPAFRRSAVTALQSFVDDYLVPVWNTPAEIHWTVAEAAGALNMCLQDAPFLDQTAAYHDFTKKPYAVVNVDTVDELLTVAMSHELCEMLVNPGINMWAGIGPDPENIDSKHAPHRFRCLEVADPVEDCFFDINGHLMSDFVYPAYFEPWRDGKLDLLGMLHTPGEIMPGGYQILMVNGREGEIFGPRAMKRCFRHKLIWDRLTKATSLP